MGIRELVRVMEEEKRKVMAVENKLFVMQRSVYHAQTWSVIAVTSMVVVMMMGRVWSRRRREEEKEVRALQKQVVLLQKQIAALQPVTVKKELPSPVSKETKKKRKA